MSTVCAIVPTFNRADMLRECLTSLLAQTRPPDEILIVDDGSRDHTKAVIESFGPRVRAIHQENSGKSAALNRALSETDADYVWICDDDDIAAPQGLEHLACTLDADDTLDFAYGMYRNFTETKAGREMNPLHRWIRPDEDSVLIYALEECFTYQFAQLVKRTTFERVGRFREDLVRCADYEMLIRMARNCRSAFVPEIIFFQRGHMGERGPLSDRFPAERMSAKAFEYEQKIFRELHGSLRMEEIAPRFARGLDEALRRRASLIQRACIFANHGVWDLAADDILAASEIEPDSAPSAEERRLPVAVLISSRPWNTLMAVPSCVDRLTAARISGRFGREIVSEFCRPLLWHSADALKRRAFGAALDRGRLLCSILGVTETIRRVKGSWLY